MPVLKSVNDLEHAPSICMYRIQNKRTRCRDFSNQYKDFAVGATSFISSHNMQFIYILSSPAPGISGRFGNSPLVDQGGAAAILQAAATLHQTVCRMV